MTGCGVLPSTCCVPLAAVSLEGWPLAVPLTAGVGGRRGGDGHGGGAAPTLLWLLSFLVEVSGGNVPAASLAEPPARGLPICAAATAAPAAASAPGGFAVLPLLAVLPVCHWPCGAPLLPGTVLCA